MGLTDDEIAELMKSVGVSDRRVDEMKLVRRDLWEKEQTRNLEFKKLVDEAWLPL